MKMILNCLLTARWLHRLCAVVLLLWLAIGAQAAQYVIVISVDGLGGTYLSKLFDGTATGGPYAIPNFTRLKNEGVGTLAAHCDNDNWETLPNHTSIVTGRPRDGVAGHNWTSNRDPAVGQTIHSNKGSYVAGVFDVAHDNGLRTGMYANKSKFMLFDTYGSYIGGGSYNATYGAPDTTGVDNGRDKIDNSYINTALGGIIVDTFITQQKSATPNHYAFLHINEPDAYGHSTGWGSATRNSQVVVVDTMLGRVFKLVEQDVPAMIGTTAIILTADHGNQDNPPTGADRYAVPFYVWGPGVKAGADLYSLNAATRQAAASYPMTTYAGMQPVRNAEANNLALQMLGLGPIPGSTFNYAQELKVTPATVTLNISFAGAGGNKVESTSPDHSIDCLKGNPAGCSASFITGQQVTLSATADGESIFAGWSANAPAGVVTMDSDKTVTATFDASPAKVRIDNSATVYYTLGAALADAPAPLAPVLATEIRAQAMPTVFVEDIIMTNPVAILLKGGYVDEGFSDQSGYSTIVGFLKLQTGKLLVERLNVKAP
jgi:hypothetical protein